MQGLLKNSFWLAGIMFLMVSSASASVVVTEDQSVADKFTRYTVTGIRTALPQTPDVPGLRGASYLTIEDVDQDGIKEIICTSGIGLDASGYTPTDGIVALYKKDGSLDNWTQSIINSTFAFPNETVVRDMDNDGDLDIMVMDNFSAGWFTCGVGGIYWLENLDGDITSASNWVRQELHVDTGNILDPCGCPSFCASGTCDPSQCSLAYSSYHRVRFLHVDNDTLEDFVTTKVHMWYWSWTEEQYIWTEWFRGESDRVTYPSGFSGPSELGFGAGFLFDMADVVSDGDQDVIAPQFFMYDTGFVPRAPGDTRGDSFMWFENPGRQAMTDNASQKWTYHTIDNLHTSPTTLGRGMEAIPTNIDNDTDIEILYTTHNHQQYSTYSGTPRRFWPAGLYYFEIPEDPASVSQWTPIAIDCSDPNLDPDNQTAVLNDVYAVDRDFNDYNGQGSPGMVRAQDITGDDLPEILVPGDGKGKLYYYESNGLLSWKRAALYADVACMPGEAKFDDIDEDGRTDVIAAIYDTSAVKVKGQTSSSSIFIFTENRDMDLDGVCNPGETDPGYCTGSDNCPQVPNGPDAGTCTNPSYTYFGLPCTSPGINTAECGPDGYCSMNQEDEDLDGIGDACESFNNCKADISGPPPGNPDGKVDSWDLLKMKQEFGRTGCTPSTCKADIAGPPPGNPDGKVDSWDLLKMKQEFGRSDCLD